MGVNAVMLHCPNEVANVWWRPLLRAGYKVWVASADYLARLCSTYNKSTEGWDDQVYAFICVPRETEIASYSDSLTMPVSADFDIIRLTEGVDRAVAYLSLFKDIQSQNDSRRCLWIRLGGDWDLVASLSRMYVASGCTPCWERTGFEMIYACSEDLLLTLPTCFANMGLDIEELDDRSQTPRYRCGLLRKGKAEVRIYTGPALGHAPDIARAYVALLYRLPLLYPSRVEAFVAELGGVFFRYGATRIEVQPYKPGGVR